MAALPVVMMQHVTHCPVPTERIWRCGRIQVGHGAADASAVICLDTDSDEDAMSSGSIHSSDSVHSSDSIHSRDSMHSKDSISGDDSVDFEGGDDSSDNGGEPPVSSEGLPIDLQIACVRLGEILGRYC